ncbi:MAG: hypothetical protein EXR75_01360 [Myxococcales bacterium]|nr:hypothetical protein [Myxococcales bacterium]
MAAGPSNKKRTRRGNDDDGFDVVVEPEQFELRAGASIAGVRLVEPIERGEKIACWRGQRTGGSAVTVHAVLPGATERERGCFLKAAGRLAAMRRDQFIAGITAVTAVVPGADVYVADVAASGTMADIPVLGWDFVQRLAFVVRIGVVLGEMHRAGLFHGCIRPQNILLDEQFMPVLSDIGAIDIEDSFPGTAETRHEYWAYAAREVRQGANADARSDVFSFGRLLYFIIAEEEADEPDEEVPRLERLREGPPGLVRIVRRATARDPGVRYPDIDAMLEEIGRHALLDGIGIAHAAPGAGPRARLPSVSAHPSQSKKPDAKGGNANKLETKPADAKRDPARRPSAVPAAPGVGAAPTSSDGAFAVGSASLSSDPLTGALPAVFGGVGLTTLAALAFWSHATADARPWQFFVGILAALFASAVLPAGARPRIARPVWALVCVVAVVVGNPWRMAADAGRAGKFASVGPAEKAALIRRLAATGVKHFGALELAGVGLRGERLAEFDFSGSKLPGCIMTRAVLKGANFANADVTNCDFRGADLSGAEFDTSVGWRDSLCDAETKMPYPWTCEKGAPKSKFDIPTLR